MRAIILTGGSGYIGSAIGDAALKQGYIVINIDKIFPEYFDCNTPGYKWYQDNLCHLDPRTYCDIEDDLCGVPVEAVIHLAAYKDIENSLFNPYEYYKNNLISLLVSLNVANYFRAKTFIFSSSAAVYDESLRGAVHESDTRFHALPHTAYGKSKLWGEEIVEDVCSNRGIKFFSLRYQNPIGNIEGVTYDKSDSIFGSIFRSIRDNTEFVIFGDQYLTPDHTCIRDYVDIRDVARLHLEFINKTRGDNGIYNIGTGKPTSCLQVCNIIKELYPEFKFRIGNARVGDAEGSYADTKKLNSIGLKTKIDIKDSIKSIINDALHEAHKK